MKRLRTTCRARRADALDRDNRATMYPRQGDETAVHRLVAWAPLLVTAEKRHGARAAFSLGAALLAAGATRRAQPFEQRAMWVDIVYAHALAIELEHCRCHAKRSIRAICGRGYPVRAGGVLSCCRQQFCPRELGSERR